MRAPFFTSLKRIPPGPAGRPNVPLSAVSTGRMMVLIGGIAILMIAFPGCQAGRRNAAAGDQDDMLAAVPAGAGERVDASLDAAISDSSRAPAVNEQLPPVGEPIDPLETAIAEAAALASAYLESEVQTQEAGGDFGGGNEAPRIPASPSAAPDASLENAISAAPGGHPESSLGANEPALESGPNRPKPTVIWSTPTDDAAADAGVAELYANTAAESTSSSAETDATIAGGDSGTAPVASPIAPPSRAQIMVDFARRLHQDAADSDTPLREYLGVASMTIIDAERRVNPDSLYMIRSESDRELFAACQDFFIDLGRLVNDGADREQIVESIDRMREQLAIESANAFSIPAFKLTTSVQSFGDYREIEDLTFVRGRPHEVIAYIEVDHFESTQTASGSWRTRISTKLELYTDADGLLVFAVPESTAEDIVLRPRRDFFLVQHLVLPSNLSLGKYHLKARLRDEQTGAEAEAVIPIQIVASAGQPYVQ